MKKKNAVFSTKISIIGALTFILMGVVVLIFSHNYIKSKMDADTEKQLSVLAGNIAQMYDYKYPGDYELVSDEKGYLHLYKGDADISQDYDLVDNMKKTTGYDYSLIFKDLRVHSTLVSKGSRLTGTKVNDDIIGQVKPDLTPLFSKNVIISGQAYYVYYLPLTIEESYIGMIEICASEEKAAALSSSISYMLLALCLIFAVFSFFALKVTTDKFTKRLHAVNKFLREVKGGTLTASMPEEVNKENDELKEIGGSAIEMQRSIRNMIEMDTLTGLYNRRFSNRKLDEIIIRNMEKDQPFSVCICDIDHFKRVNDTYGHDAGDVVLTKVADALRKKMNKNGFAARWGGEEFLLVFDKMDTETAMVELESLRETIKGMSIHAGEQTIKVTMSFGISSLGVGSDALIKNADNALYYAKENGRDRVVCLDNK